MDKSILNNVKKMLGLDENYTAFDTDVIIHINSVFSTLSQLGIGPSTGFMIEDDILTWDDFFETADPNLNAVKTYVYLRVRLLFDPPATSFAISAMNEQIRELEWRLNSYREVTAWTEPMSEPTPEVTVMPTLSRFGATM